MLNMHLMPPFTHGLRSGSHSSFAATIGTMECSNIHAIQHMIQLPQKMCGARQHHLASTVISCSSSTSITSPPTHTLTLSTSTSHYSRPSPRPERLSTSHTLTQVSIPKQPRPLTVTLTIFSQTRETFHHRSICCWILNNSSKRGQERFSTLFRDGAAATHTHTDRERERVCVCVWCYRGVAVVIVSR